MNRLTPKEEHKEGRRSNRESSAVPFSERGKKRKKGKRLSSIHSAEKSQQTAQCIEKKGGRGKGKSHSK